jgi:hypothetical protein
MGPGLRSQAVTAFVLAACAQAAAGAGVREGWDAGGSSLIGLSWDRDRGRFDWDGSPPTFHGADRLSLHAQSPELAGVILFAKWGAEWARREPVGPAIEWRQGRALGTLETGGMTGRLDLFSRFKLHRLPAPAHSLTGWETSGGDDGVLLEVEGGRYGAGRWLQSREARPDGTTIHRRLLHYGYRSPSGEGSSGWSIAGTFLEYGREAAGTGGDRWSLGALHLKLPLPGVPRAPALLVQVGVSRAERGGDPSLWPGGRFLGPRWSWGSPESGRWSALLPPNASFHAEVRGLTTGPRGWGRLELTGRYRAMREEFENPWGDAAEDPHAPVGFSGRVWYVPPRKALTVSLGGRDETSSDEDLRVRELDLEARARLRGGFGTHLLLRGGTRGPGSDGSSRMEGLVGLSSDRGRVLQRFQAGYRDFPGGNEGPLLAWEARLRISSRVLFYQRLVAAGSERGVSTRPFFSLELQPARGAAIFLAFGSPAFGDGPYPALDRDLLTGGPFRRLWTLTFRAWL